MTVRKRETGGESPDRRGVGHHAYLQALVDPRLNHRTAFLQTAASEKRIQLNDHSLAGADSPPVFLRQHPAVAHREIVLADLEVELAGNAQCLLPRGPVRDARQLRQQSCKLYERILVAACDHQDIGSGHLSAEAKHRIAGSARNLLELGYRSRVVTVVRLLPTLQVAQILALLG